jgi:hypothetical protein
MLSIMANGLNVRDEASRAFAEPFLFNTKYLNSIRNEYGAWERLLTGSRLVRLYTW